MGSLPYMLAPEQRTRQSKTCVAVAFLPKFGWGAGFGWKFSSILPRRLVRGAQEEQQSSVCSGALADEPHGSPHLEVIRRDDSWAWNNYLIGRKRKSGALKYHLGISKTLVFLGSLAELLIKTILLSFLHVNYIFLHFAEFRGTVNFWVLKKKEVGRKGKSVTHLAWLIWAEKCCLRILQRVFWSCL